MHPHRSFPLVSLLLLLPTVHAGPGGYLALINGTPYNWILTYSHSYQLDWKPPSLIAAGTSYQQYIEYWYHWGENGDCAGEATYTLVNANNEELPLSFTIHARQQNGKSLQIQYHDDLASLGNPKESLLNLGFRHDGVVSFILAGNSSNDFVSSNPPTAWMQATLPSIGEKNLRELAMPYSHDSGMSEVTRLYGGLAHNTVTQSFNIYDQLKFGSRWFDIRPMHRKGVWFTQHMSAFGQDMFGCTGRTIDNIVKDINKFTAENPGELIILDISHELDDARVWRQHLSDVLWQKLYVAFSKIDDLWCTPCSHLSDDLSSVPLSTFIKPGSRSAVLIRVPDWAPAPSEKHSKNSRRNDRIGDSGRRNETSRGVPPNPTRVRKVEGIEAVAPEASASAVPADGEENPSPFTSATPLPTPTVRAFVPYSRLPFTGSWSNSDVASSLASDQLGKLSEARTSTNSFMHRSTWTITQGWQHITDVGVPNHSLISDARNADIVLFEKLWNALSEKTYPNLIEIDDIHDSGLTALCMAINRYFALRG